MARAALQHILHYFRKIPVNVEVIDQTAQTISNSLENHIRFLETRNPKKEIHISIHI